VRHRLPDLPFSGDALEPLLSAETLEFHHGKHHRGYVEKLNALVAGTPFAEAPLEETVRRSTGTILDIAAQHYNHSFYWNCLAPGGAAEPTGALARAIDAAFGSFAGFRERFTERALSLFGSGWCWLVLKQDGRLQVEPLSNAGCPIRAGDVPLLTCDVWEHAYYIDYRNDRARYVEAFWQLVHWRFVEERHHAAATQRL
jgi:Fe-Mn family superoxide dismutase